MKSIKNSRHRIRDKENMPFSPVNKKLNFSFDALDSSDLAPQPCDAMSMGDALNHHHVQFDLEIYDKFNCGLPGENQKVDSENFSPCRTRSGRVYELREKKKRRLRASKRPRKTLRTRMNSGQSGTGSLVDCSEEYEESEDDNDASEDLGGIEELNHSFDDRIDNFPNLDMDEEMSNLLEGAVPYPPPLNYNKHPVSRFSEPHCRPFQGIPSSPISYCVMDDSSPVKHTTKVINL